MRYKEDGTPYRQSKTSSLYQVKGSKLSQMKYYINVVPKVESTGETLFKRTVGMKVGTG